MSGRRPISAALVLTAAAVLSGAVLAAAGSAAGPPVPDPSAPAPAVPPAAAPPPFEEIVARLAAAEPALRSFIADQVIEVRLLGLFRWRLRATVYAERPARYTVVLHDPPPLLRGLGPVFADATSPERMLALYRPVSIRLDGEGIVAEVEGRTPEVNPPRARVTIDPRRWVVTAALLRYAWGEVRASSQYAEVDGYYLPVRIRMAVPGAALRAEVMFVAYRLNAPLPDLLPGSAPPGR